MWRDLVKRPDGSFFQTTGHDHDAALIALMRNALPEILDALERRTEMLRDARRMLMCTRAVLLARTDEGTEAMMATIDAELEGK